MCRNPSRCSSMTDTKKDWHVRVLTFSHKITVKFFTKQKHINLYNNPQTQFALKYVIISYYVVTGAFTTAYCSLVRENMCCRTLG